MTNKRHAIVTACNAKCGDFLAEHWLRSLTDHVTLDDVDVIVLDYGLNAHQRAAVDRGGAIRRCFENNGFVNNLRFRDVARLVAESPYEQVMLVDSGDVIFQSDIRHLFDQEKHSFRVVCEELYTAQYEHFISTSDFRDGDYRRLVDSVRGTRIINTGMILGPGHKFAALWPAMKEIVQDVQNWGTLQLVINHLFYQQGFVELPYRYNFVLMTARSKFRIRHGRFFDNSGQLIPIVHNAGGTSALRSIKNFGYGPDRNVLKPVAPLVLKLFLRLVEWWKGQRHTVLPRRMSEHPA